MLLASHTLHTRSYHSPLLLLLSSFLHPFLPLYTLSRTSALGFRTCTFSLLYVGSRLSVTYLSLSYHRRQPSKSLPAPPCQIIPSLHCCIIPALRCTTLCMKLLYHDAACSTSPSFPSFVHCPSSSPLVLPLSSPPLVSPRVTSC